MAYTLIETHTVGAGGATEIEFTGIEAVAGANLVLQVSGKSTRTNSPRDNIKLQFNSVTSGYSYKFLEGTGSTANSSGASSQAQILITHALSTNFSGLGNLFGSATITIPDYAGSQNKSVSSDETGIRNSTDSHSAIQASISTITSPITSVYLSPENGDFMEHTTASLYLVTTANASGASVPKATGGTISLAGGYWIHTFTSSGTFTPSESLTCDYLVIAGGGGGGGNHGGGGGAGGYLTGSLALSAQAYSVTVGAGGGSGSGGNPGGTGGTGSNSAFSTITSSGGGGGGRQFVAGNSGGSGGGGGNANPGGSATPSGQGFAGGSGSIGEPEIAGGGGGAFSVGVSGAISGDGGNPESSSITGSTVYYAGGGGGGSRSDATPGDAPLGIGGDGSNSTSTPGGNGTALTGGGGGGGGRTYANGSGAAGGSGGSGIVIVRYAA